MTKYQVGERLLLYIKEINLTVHALENICGFSVSYLTKMNFELPENKVEQILEALPNLNKEWLLTGDGDMRLGGEDRVISNGTTIAKQDNSKFDPKKREEIMSRLLEIIQKEGIKTIRDFEKRIGVFRGTWDNALKRGTQRTIIGWVDCVITMFPGYSYDWAIFGTGPMRLQKGYLPLFDLNNLGQKKCLIGQYSIPGIPTADALYRTPCDSIDKTIKRGDIVSCKNINIDKDLSINLSKQYIIIPECDEDVFISRIKETEGKISLINDNDQVIYSLGLGDIVYLGQIVGYIHNL